MADDQEIFIGDKVQFTVKTKTDLSTASKMEVHIYKPDKTLEKLTGTIHPTDNTKFRASTAVGATPTLNDEGTYRGQAYIENALSEPNHGTEFTFDVLTPLEDL